MTEFFCDDCGKPFKANVTGIFCPACCRKRNGYKFGEWIPVSERLPEKPGCVLCMWKYIGEDETYCDRLNFDGDRFPWENFGPYSKHKVTHWMPLPEPPKEEKNNG